MENCWQISLVRFHPGKRLKFKMISQYLSGQSTYEDCLDIGTGSGGLAFLYRVYGRNWRYIESDELVLKEARKLLPAEEFASSMNQLGDQQYDLITIIDTFYYFVEPEAMIDRLRKHLKPEGEILITLTDGEKNRLINRLRSRLGVDNRARGFAFEELPEEFIKRFTAKEWKVKYFKTFSFLFSELLLLLLDYLNGRQKKAKKSAVSFLTSRQPVSAEKIIFLKLLLPLTYLSNLADYLIKYFSAGYKFILVVNPPEENQ